MYDDENVENIDFSNLNLTESYSNTSLSLLSVAFNMKKRKSLSMDNLFYKPKQLERFESLAEQVLKFNYGTPPRFKSVPQAPRIDNFIARHCTIALSPTLLTKTRVRPVYVLTQEQREAEELAEMRRHKFIATKVNEKILKEKPSLMQPEKKPLTVPEPFNLTEMKRKDMDSPESIHFHAQPIPTKLFTQITGVKPVSPRPNTQPITPRVLKNSRKKEPESNNSTISSNSIVNTSKTLPKICPFSFDERDKAMLRKKEETIRKFLEDERKLREFHAQPLPRYLKHDLSKTEMSNVSTCSSETSESSIFKARPAKVLKQKPFVPKKSNEPIVVPVDVTLHSDRRACEREKFDEYVREKQRQAEVELEVKKREQMELEAEKIRELRKQAEIKARPVPKYREKIDVKSTRELTVPKTPICLKRCRVASNNP